MQMYNNQSNMQSCEYLPYMQMMPSSVSPMMTMPDQQLEAMYPRIYNVIYPAVVQCCMMMGTGMYAPTKEMLDAMADRVMDMTGDEVEAAIGPDTAEEERQLGFGRRSLVRDLATILLIRELLGRRPYYPGYYPGYFPGSYPGFYPGYYGGFSGYPY